MNSNKWNKYLFLSKYPPSLTTKSPEHLKESREFVIKAITGFEKGKSLLVLGCGDGYEVDLAREAGFHAKGISVMKEEVGLRTDIELGDIHDLPYQGDSFDYIISKETLEHLMAPIVGLYEMNRVMKLGGRFTHYIPSGMGKQRDWYHYSCFPDWIWVDLMYKAGFEVESVEYDIMQLKYSGKKVGEPHYTLDGLQTRDLMPKIRKYASTPGWMDEQADSAPRGN